MVCLLWLLSNRQFLLTEVLEFCIGSELVSSSGSLLNKHPFLKHVLVVRRLSNWKIIKWTKYITRHVYVYLFCKLKQLFCLSSPLGIACGNFSSRQTTRLWKSLKLLSLGNRDRFLHLNCEWISLQMPPLICFLQKIG